ncbi:hypothetical protein [Dactylosporangium sp. CA-092794]|uniref:hypothetical protein n=1 Tax=Dactylosporangium sp. CA-092794 TaxID=3239929 RepID=UPI003D9370B1
MTAELHSRGIALTVTHQARHHLATAGMDPQLGARPLRRTIQRELENELSTRLLAATLTPGDTLTIDATPDAALTFTTAPAHPSPTTPKPAAVA